MITTGKNCRKVLKIESWGPPTVRGQQKEEVPANKAVSDIPVRGGVSGVLSALDKSSEPKYLKKEGDQLCHMLHGVRSSENVGLDQAVVVGGLERNSFSGVVGTKPNLSSLKKEGEIISGNGLCR